MRSCVLVPIAAACALAAGCSASDPNVPTPEQARYVQQISTIDSRLSDGGTTTALNLAKKICAQLARGQSDAEVAADAQRFTDGEGFISPDQAAKLVATTKDSVCKAG